MFQSPDSNSTARPGVRRVLVVDDEPTLRLGFSYALQNASTRVDTASGGAAALELFENNRYDALFLDLRMPDIDGLRVIETLRAGGNHIPIILCSAFVNLESALQAIRHRVVDFLLKPVSPADLRHALALVTGEAETPFAKALARAREGRFEEAVGMLSEADPGGGEPRLALWRRLFEFANSGRDIAEVRQAVGEKVAERIAIHAGRI